jgi:signal transduction histidine kinase
LAKGNFTGSNFRNIYLGIFSLWLAASAVVFFLSKDIIVPALIRFKAQALDTVVQSHAQNLPLFLDRALRDQLAHKNYIRSDKDFRLFLPSNESEHILSLVRDCTFVTPSVCTTGSSVTILVRGYQADPLKSLAVVNLESDHLNQKSSVFLFSLLGSLGFGVLLLAIAMGTRMKARILGQHVEALNKVVDDISQQFEISSQADKNEFVSMSHSLEQIGEKSRLLGDRISRYKEWLTRHSALNELNNRLSHTSHDIRGPLEEGRDLLNHLPVMIENLPKEKLKEVLQSASSRFQDGINALDSALQSTKPRESTKTLATVSKLLSDLQSKALSSDKLKALKVTSALDPQLKEVLLDIDPQELESVLWNIAQNSIEANATQLHIELEGSNGKAIITLSDNGDGVPAWLAPDIFSEFVTSKKTGSGIGLASVAKVLKSAGGGIELKSSPRGATFVIELPVKNGEQNV